jgi:hypothetical protein
MSETWFPSRPLSIVGRRRQPTAWSHLSEALPPGPPLTKESISKAFKLALEVKHVAALMTMSCDVHNVQTMPYLVSFWPLMDKTMQWFVAHRPQLLYAASAKGQPATLHYNQQQVNKYFDTAPDFWASFQPPWPRVALQVSQTRGCKQSCQACGKTRQGDKVLRSHWVFHIHSPPTSPVSLTAHQCTDGHICQDRQLWK